MRINNSTQITCSVIALISAWQNIFSPEVSLAEKQNIQLSWALFSPLICSRFSSCRYRTSRYVRESGRQAGISLWVCAPHSPQEFSPFFSLFLSLSLLKDFLHPFLLTWGSYRATGSHFSLLEEQISTEMPYWPGWTAAQIFAFFPVCVSLKE